jgi:hypothetical protein
MDVGNERDITARLAQTVADVLKVFGDDTRLRRHADDLTTRLSQSECLFHTGICITRVTGEHALHHYRCSAADLDLADHDRTRFTALVVVEVRTVAKQGGGHGGALECQSSFDWQSKPLGSRILPDRTLTLPKIKVAEPSETWQNQ